MAVDSLGVELLHNNKRKIRLCVIINPSFGLTLPYGKRWEYLKENNFECWAIAGPGPEHEQVRARGVQTKVIEMQRYPSPLKDIFSLIWMWWYLLFHRFDVIEISTPKASFLGAIAAFFSGHRHILYLVRGRPYENMSGLKRKLLSFLEKLTCHLSSVVVPISKELGANLVNERICPVGKIRIIGSGSSKGVDLSRFSRTPEHLLTKNAFRRQIGINDNDVVGLFVGWLRREKGVNELVRSFSEVAKYRTNAHLLLLGDYERSDPLEKEREELINSHPQIHHLPWSKDPAEVYGAADFVVFPSWREGFGNVPLEAGAMGLASIVSDIPGLREAVLHNKTGLVVGCSDLAALIDAINCLIDNPTLRERLAKAAHHRVTTEFRQEIIWKGTADIFCELAKQ